MLRFRLGGIPVEVHLSHLLFSALLGVLMVRDMPALDPNVWPYRELQHPGRPGYAPTALLVVASWMLIIFLSALVHESGHALMLRAFGYRPSIQLIWLGGTTRPNSPIPIPWNKLVAITAAGPLSGLLLALGSAGLRHYVVAADSERLRFLLSWFFMANVFWALFNLLPVPTLDGGTILSTLAARFFGKTGFMGAQLLALVLCIALVAFGARHAPVLAILFGLYGFQALRLLMATSRGDLQVSTGVAPEPLVRELQQARAAMSGGRLDEARQRTLSVLDAPGCTPELASRAHHLLGWVALKNGQGRMALDHFAQAQRMPVETHALAAAFSLIGDEPRALTLWEMAWQETQDRTVLHEYAGSLIRAERVHKALRLPGVDAETAFICAERPLFIRGAYSEAAAIAEAGLLHAPAARLAYDAACAHARARHPHDAMRMLRRATELGFDDAPYAESDEDLSALHGYPDFERWLTELQKSVSA
ncbi:site-2 protease family protein [Vitiosangium sp. GDMCC 1.1324]|uniref:site-2 protease family protein n=1 Tax=Vitiosangium sp. (strain GDMCC 1.1324) TaxID=2138576 RepID=UPI000D35B85A|nr:site-2 protease family protein [Vitiosangium sp. GDMCC 1.1324]PTL84091.1 peptidase M50 [Vitiosangium sp. GDMCC 1.1324]